MHSKVLLIFPMRYIFPSLAHFFWSFSHLISLQLSTRFNPTAIWALCFCTKLQVIRKTFFTLRWLLNKQMQCWIKFDEHKSWLRRFYLIKLEQSKIIEKFQVFLIYAKIYHIACSFLPHPINNQPWQHIVSRKYWKLSKLDNAKLYLRYFSSLERLWEVFFFIYFTVWTKCRRSEEGKIYWSHLARKKFFFTFICPRLRLIASNLETLPIITFLDMQRERKSNKKRCWGFFFFNLVLSTW